MHLFFLKQFRLQFVALSNGRNNVLGHRSFDPVGNYHPLKTSNLLKTTYTAIYTKLR